MTTFFALHQPSGVDFACSDCLNEARTELLVDAPDLSVAELKAAPTGDVCGWCGAKGEPDWDAVDEHVDEQRELAGAKEWD